MAGFLIKPNWPMHPRVWDNQLLWEEEGIYVMVSHRLALWCWMQCEGVFDGEYALVHIDRHTDARGWEADGEPAALKQIVPIIRTLKDFGVYESFQVPTRLILGRDTRPAITYDNFVALAAHAKLFSHYYIYSSVGDWKLSIQPDSYHLRKKVKDVYGFGHDIQRHAGKCVVDVDLDFFDYEDIFPKKLTEDALLENVFRTIVQHKDEISMITISINESPGDQLWEKRQHQLSIAKRILGMKMPVPIMGDGEGLMGISPLF